MYIGELQVGTRADGDWLSRKASSFFLDGTRTICKRSVRRKTVLFFRQRVFHCLLPPRLACSQGRLPRALERKARRRVDHGDRGLGSCNPMDVRDVLRHLFPVVVGVLGPM